MYGFSLLLLLTLSSLVRLILIVRFQIQIQCDRVEVSLMPNVQAQKLSFHRNNRSSLAPVRIERCDRFDCTSIFPIYILELCIFFSQRVYVLLTFSFGYDEICVI